MLRNKRFKIFENIKNHIQINLREYLTVFLIFVVGIFIGVLYINNISEQEKQEIIIYFQQFISNFKNVETLNLLELLKSSIVQNVFIAIVIWFFGTTVIGIPVVFLTILYRGFCLGYTISTIITVFGAGQGSIFVFSMLVIQNILFIPAILGIGVSSIRLYKSIIKDRKVENIKFEIIKHTIFSIIMLIIILVSSLLEVFVSNNLFKMIVNYF